VQGHRGRSAARGLPGAAVPMCARCGAFTWPGLLHGQSIRTPHKKEPGCRHERTECSWCLHILCISKTRFCNQDMVSCTRGMLPCSFLRVRRVGHWCRPVTRLAGGMRLAMPRGGGHCHEPAGAAPQPRAARRGGPAGARRDGLGALRDGVPGGPGHAARRRARAGPL